jgi:mRNA-degrading endonuclease RelE of RelBE toxin-antitoxin system
MPKQWAILLSSQAARQLAGLPRDQQVLIGRAIDRMQSDPFQGDVKPLQGRKWHGRYRKRVGRYRLIFIPQYQACVIEISAILLRDEQTYR